MTDNATARNPADMILARWVMFMRWHDLLFMHWPVPAAALRPLIPSGLELDTWDGHAWLGVVPFHMSGIRARFLPPMRGTSAFPELNVRTYVRAGGRAGVWFFSLDAANRLAVRGARLLYHLPYFDARMSIAPDGGGFRYQSLRTHRNAAPAEFRARYRAAGNAYQTKPGELDHFLTHRLCLYSADRAGRIYRGDIAHVPWSLQPAECEIETNRMAEQLRIKLPDTPPLLHFARRLDVVAGRLRLVGRGA